MTDIGTLAKLVILDGHTAIRPAETLLQETICTIGRAARRQVVFDRHDISRLHASIAREDERYTLSDAGSQNGTFVNGRRIARPCRLTDRDLIGLAGPELLLRFVDRNHTVQRCTPLFYDTMRIVFVLRNQEVELTPL